MDAPSVDWSTAQVNGDRMSVEIAGELPKGWKRSFGLTAALLAADTPFGKVSVRGAKVTIGGIRPGDEDAVRFLLEGAVQQANADHPSHAEDEDDDEPVSEDAPADDADDPQQQMTERLRGFADE